MGSASSLIAARRGDKTAPCPGKPPPISITTSDSDVELAKEDRRFAPDASCAHAMPAALAASASATAAAPRWGSTLRSDYESVEEVRLAEAEVEEVLVVLGMARAVTVKGTQQASLRAFAEHGRIETFGAGTAVGGPHVWGNGWNLVLSGRANVVFQVDGVDQEVAMLQRGDSFGWDDEDEDDSVLDAVHSFRPRVVVLSDEPLRLCRMRWDQPACVSAGSGHRPSTVCSGGFGASLLRSPLRKRTRSKNHRVSSHGRISVATCETPKQPSDDGVPTVRELLGGAHACELGGISDWLANLWLTASPPAGGIGELSGGLLHAHFLAALWAPLLEELEQHRAEIRVRKAQGYRIHDCFPLQGHQIVELREQVYHLTEIWYGSNRGGNLSAMYRWFIGAMHLLGVTAYSFDIIPQERSPDGWAVAINGEARAAALKDKGSNDATYVAAGGVKQRQGRSAIDNTVLRNVFMPAEARELIIGRRLRKTLCKFLVMRQICLLRRLSAQLQLDLLWMASEAASVHGHTAVRAVLQSLPASALRSAGVDPDSLCARMLRERGCVIAGFGQLSSATQQAVQQECRRLLGVDEHQPARADAEDVFERLVAWCRDKPGEFFEGGKRRHVEVKIAGLLAGKVIIVKRSCMERFSLARYFPLAWRRTQPLYGVFANGAFPVRPADMPEASHVRVNECPYAPLHGMSLSGGGYASDPHVKKSKKGKGGGVGYSLLMELQWVRDPSANVENWFLTDIEKILQEAYQLNPHGRKELMLPGETFVNVGQNPKVGSSIRETQHTQLCEGSLSSYPVLQLETSPRWSAKLGAFLDLVEVAPPGIPQDQRGLFVKLNTESPTSPQVLGFLISLRLRLMELLGGGDNVDFLVLACANERGGFTVLFAPMAQLVKIGEEKPDFADWANPLTGELSESSGLQEARLDFGKGVGQFLVAKQALREQILAGGEDFLRRVWAFNRVPGAREAIEGFLHEREIFQD